MDPLTESALIGTAGSLVQSGGNVISEILFGRRNHKFAQDNMRLSAELMRDQYDYEREQESPENERRRLEAAGLSPALLYGQGGSSGMSASISSMSAPGASSSGVAPIGNLAKSFSDVALTRAQIENLDQNTAKQKTETDYNRESMQYRIAILSNEKTAGLFEYQIKAIDAIFREKITELNISKLQTEIDTMAGQLANAKDLTEIERQRVQGYLDSVSGQLSLWKSDIALKEEQIETEDAKQLLINARTALSNASKSEVEERIKNYSAQRDKIDAEINRIGKLNKLTKYHIREIKNNIALRWATFGVNTVKDVSSEVRKWINTSSSEDELRQFNYDLLDLLEFYDIFIGL